MMERTGASQAAIISHYDMGDEFFRLILGPEMIYSCALFDNVDDLDAAQQLKLDHHIEAAGAIGVARVLDIGCGWGAMLRRLVKHASVKHVVGLTLSPSQARWIQRDQLPNVEVIVEDWRDHRPAERYNSIISVGAFEHFVQKGLDPAKRLNAYRDFFAFCDRVLVAKGKLSLQTINFNEPHTLHPVVERTFPESDLPLIWEPIAAAEGRFQLIAARNDPDHYYRTLRFWEQNLQERYSDAVTLVGETAVKEFRHYLKITAMGFKTGSIGLIRMNFVKKPAIAA
jgi:cyclopropane-fatty-acyl-phospholipid synthase